MSCKLEQIINVTMKILYEKSNLDTCCRHKYEKQNDSNHSTNSDQNKYKD